MLENVNRPGVESRTSTLISNGLPIELYRDDCGKKKKVYIFYEFVVIFEIKIAIQLFSSTTEDCI